MKARRMTLMGHVARVAEKRNAYRLSVGKPEGKRPLRRPRRRWVYNINMDLFRDRLVINPNAVCSDSQAFAMLEVESNCGNYF
jgi:hypothetical protein